MKITPIGKEMRKLRIDTSETLVEMSSRLSKSPSFISSIETGKKLPPIGFEDNLCAVYGLGGLDAEKFQEAADQSRENFHITAKTALMRKLVGTLSRKAETLTDDVAQKIIDLMK